MGEGISLGMVVGLIQSMLPEMDPTTIEAAVQEWLDNHPEATTTVADGSITEQKLATAVAAKLAEVPVLKSAFNSIINRTDTIFNVPDYYTDDSKYVTYGGTGTIYASMRVIPSGATLKTVKVWCKTTSSTSVLLVVDHSTNKVLDVFSESTASGENTFSVNKTYTSDVIIAFLDVLFIYTAGNDYPEEYAMNADKGLYQASGSSVPVVGDTLTFSHVGTTQYYYVKYQTNYEIIKQTTIKDAEKLIAFVEEDATADRAYSTGEYLISDNKFKIVTNDIEQGGTIDNQNTQNSTVADELRTLKNSVNNEGFTNVENKEYPKQLFNPISLYNNGSAATSIYFADDIIPAGSLVRSVKYMYSSSSANTMFVVVNKSTSKIIDVIFLARTASNQILTQIINKTYDVDIIYGFFGAAFKFAIPSPVDSDYIYSVCIKEMAMGSSVPAIGDTITITASTNRYNYCLAAQTIYTVYTTIAFSELLDSDEENRAISFGSQKWLPVGLQANHKNLRYANIPEKVGFVGRWYDMVVNNTACKVTNNCGSELYMRVKGATTLTITWIPMTETNAYYAYSIDGGSLTRVAIESGQVSIPDTGEHIVRVITDGITENIGKWANGTGFALSSVSVDSGTITGLYPMNPQIMFFGDSIVEGVLALGSADDMGDVNSATGAFPWFCAEKIGAVSLRVGYGATGVITVGSFNTAINTLNYLYSAMPVPNYYPDAIVVEYGTNDGTSGFINAYNAFLSAMRIKYPGVRIYLFVPLNQTHAADIAAIAAENTDCVLIDTAGWYNGSLHPSAADAKTIGERLADVLKNDIYGLSD